jgi:hypothetical protein
VKRTLTFIAALAVAPVAFADRWVPVGTLDTGAYSGVVAQLDTATITSSPGRDGNAMVVVTVRYTRADGQPFSDSAAHKQFVQVKETYRLFCGARSYEDAWTKLYYADGQSEEASHWDNSRAQISQAGVLNTVLQMVCKAPNVPATAVAKVNQ